MPDIIKDILRDPQEYRPALILLAAVLSIWLLLCACAVASARRFFGRRWLNFSLAFAPLLLGLIGVTAQIPLSIQSNGVRWDGDLRWLFLVPALLGAVALIKWWRYGRRKEHGT